MQEDTASKNDPYTDPTDPDGSADSSVKDSQPDTPDHALSGSDVPGTVADPDSSGLTLTDP